VTRFRVIAAVCAVAVVAVLVLVLSGGGNDTTLVSGSALADAANATGQVPGASASMDGTVTVEGAPEPIHIRMHGVQNTRQRAAYLVGTYENFPKHVPGENPDGSIPVEGVTILPHIYMKSPLFSSALPAGKAWLDIDLAKTGKQLGIGDPTQFGASSDPSQLVQTLRAVSSRVERVGTESVRGVATTHYRARVELRRLPAVAPPSKRAQARRSSARLIQLIGTDSYPIEAWVDAHHLIRRMKLKMTMKIQGHSLTQDMTFELFDFGPKHRIKAPPADQTFEAPAASGSAGP
jgi:hypothetical protein